MLTRTNIKHIKEENDLETNHFLSIPENIQKVINERWFHLYEWIWDRDFKNNLQKDFLESIDNYWSSLIFLSIILWLLSFYIWDSRIFILIFLINLFPLFRSILVWIQRSALYRENAYVVLTNSHISINWSIINISNFKEADAEKMEIIASIFEERLFTESKLDKSKKSLWKSIWIKFIDWFKNIFNIWKEWWKDTIQLVIIWFVLYISYSLFLLFIYVFWVSIIWLLSIFLSFINKQILLIKWHKITKINLNFEDLDHYSNELVLESNNLKIFLNQANENDWRDSLSININKKLELINVYAEKSIETNKELKSDIEKSKYKEMFNFSIYNSWIKKQIENPLLQIEKLLIENNNSVQKNIIEIEEIIKTENDYSRLWALKISKERLELRKVELDNHIEKIQFYLNKLK